MSETASGAYDAHIEGEWVPRPVPPRRHQEDDVNRADIETAREEAQGATA